MLMQAIRDRMHGLIALGIIGLIIVVFILWGASNYLEGAKDPVLAKVNGEKILANRVEREYERIARQVATPIEDPTHYKQQIANALINNEALFQAIAKRRLLVNEDQIIAWLMEEPQFKDEEGNFSKQKFLDILNANYYTEREFTRDMQRGLLINQFEQGIIHTAFALPFEVTEQIKQGNQKRTVNYLTINPRQFESQLVEDTGTLEKFYQAHLSQYQTPVRVKVEYLDLAYFDLANSMTASEEEAMQYYQDNLHVFTVPPQAHASHILIALPKTPTPEQQKKADETVALIKERLAKGESFSDLAKTFSDDTFSGKKGGDLDWFSKGMMDPTFEEKAFSMKVGEISEPIKTEYGYHFIYLHEKQDENKRPFAEVKNTVFQLVKTQKADQAMSEKGEQMSTLAFENPHDLAAVAEKLGLKLQQSDWLDINNPGQGIIGDALFLKTAFSEEIIEQRTNSDVIEINPQHYVVLRVVEHEPARQQSFEEVKSLVSHDWKAAESQAKALALAEELRSKLNEKDTFQQLLAKHQLHWQSKTDLSQSTQQNAEKPLEQFLTQVAFELPRPISEKPAIIKTAPQGEVALVQLTSVTESTQTPSENDEDFMAKMLSQAFGRLDYQLFVKDALHQAKIERFDN